METSEQIKLARRKLCFKLAEDLDPGDEPYDIDQSAKMLEMTLPMTRVEADVEMEELKSAKPMKPSIINAFKKAMECDKLEDALRCGVELKTQLAASQSREAELAREVERLREGIEAMAPALEDVSTHRAVWEQAIAGLRNKAMMRGDTDNASFWNHEVGAFQRTVAALLTPAKEPNDGK